MAIKLRPLRNSATPDEKNVFSRIYAYQTLISCNRPLVLARTPQLFHACIASPSPMLISYIREDAIMPAIQVDTLSTCGTVVEAARTVDSLLLCDCDDVDIDTIELPHVSTP